MQLVSLKVRNELVGDLNRNPVPPTPSQSPFLWLYIIFNWYEFIEENSVTVRQGL